ncbi:MAG: PD-(D/E)XK nuclease family protein [Rhodothermia bacterium]|nr:PD-(D/E)XK nuclease family protein [Rhodothermia bacterium]
MTNSTETELKELMLDEDFTSLQNLVNEEVNLMDILRVSHKELQHSNFLAWFFNPTESHNLGEFALKEFIKIYFKENQFQNLGNETGLSVFDFVQLDFEDLEIRREYKNIDLIFLSRKNEFCIVIENKIYSQEKKGQLEKYRKFIESEYPDFKHKIYIYLSLEDQEISESEQDYYVKLNYGHIIRLVEQVISSQRLKLADKTKFVFEQYLQTLKSMLNKNEEIEKVAQQLYKKYKSAFDLVFKYTTSTKSNEISNIIQNLIANEKSIRPFQGNKTYVRFQPNYFYENLDALKTYGLISDNDDFTNNWMFLFEFNVRNSQVTFDCKIGQGEQEKREKIYELYKKHNDIFTKVVKANGLLRPQWHQAFQKNILSKSEIEKYLENDSNDIQPIIEKRFRELIDKDLPKLIERINNEIKNGSS